MLFESTNPLTSRERFATRTYRNVVVIGLAFTVGAAFFSFLEWKLLSAPGVPAVLTVVAALAVAYYYYVVWNTRPIRLRCGKCKNIILANTAWECGFCKGKITNSKEFQFVDECPLCHQQPKSYRCHHKVDDGTSCSNLIYLTEDMDQAACASRLNSLPEPLGPTAREVTVKGYEEKIEDLNNLVAITRLEELVKSIKSAVEAPVEDQLVGEALKDLRKSSRQESVLDEAARLYGIECEAKFKGDKIKIRREKLKAESWAKRKFAEQTGGGSPTT